MLDYRFDGVEAIARSIFRWNEIGNSVQLHRIIVRTHQHTRKPIMLHRIRGVADLTKYNYWTQGCLMECKRDETNLKNQLISAGFNLLTLSMTTIFYLSWHERYSRFLSSSFFTEANAILWKSLRVRKRNFSSLYPVSNFIAPSDYYCVMWLPRNDSWRGWWLLW